MRAPFFVLAASCVIACSGSGQSAGDGGGSSGGGSPEGSTLSPDAFVMALVGAGTLAGVNDASACGQADLTWTLGNPISPKPFAPLDGSSQAGGAVHVSCSVDASGAMFNVQLSAELDGSIGGTLVVTGAVDASGTGTGLSGSFTSMGQTFNDRDCTFSETYDGGPVPVGGQPAQGRIWGHVDCPHASEPGGAMPRTCEASADFLFENCR
jgi:hypothetical protein